VTPAAFFMDQTAFQRPVCRLGLATRGDSQLTVNDVLHAVDRGVNFLNWCGAPDALSQAIAEMGPRRREVVVCVQFEARTAADAPTELEQILRTLRTEYVDILTFYYVEEPEEWQQIVSGGALHLCRDHVRRGQVKWLGLTTHQRPLAAEVAQSGLLDLLMIRYNAAHRGAETEIFPVASARTMPVIAYTCLRWGALLKSTPNDPPGFVVPRARAWYRFTLQHPAVTVALMAPENRAELDEDLTVLQVNGPLYAAEYEALAEHGQRVRRHAGQFP
jgi:predicted aldo/keto reductase-like oxidoreductase